jgi:cytochrome c biogenesis protein CcmG/thiol:disulfide interchange protein DsbE
VLNFFASWCTPCRAEHPLLTALAQQGALVVGVDYKDTPDKARAMLAQLGDPYAAVGQDRTGRTGLDYGITGVPETFVIGADGAILAAYRGPLDAAAVSAKIVPALKRAEALKKN